MFKKTLISLSCAAVMAGAPAFAGSAFYLTVPLTSKSVPPIGSVSVNLFGGSLANGLVDDAYSASLKNHLSVTW